MFFRLDDPGREAGAEEVSTASAAAIRALGVHSVQPLHSGRQAFLLCVEDEVVMRGHEAVRVQRPFVRVNALAEKAQERDAIDVVEEGRGLVDGDSRDVKEPVAQHPSQHARHAATLALGERQNEAPRVFRHAAVALSFD